MRGGGLTKRGATYHHARQETGQRQQVTPRKPAAGDSRCRGAQEIGRGKLGCPYFELLHRTIFQQVEAGDGGRNENIRKRDKTRPYFAIHTSARTGSGIGGVFVRQRTLTSMERTWATMARQRHQGRRGADVIKCPADCSGDVNRLYRLNLEALRLITGDPPPRNTEGHIYCRCGHCGCVWHQPENRRLGWDATIIGYENNPTVGPGWQPLERPQRGKRWSGF